MTTPSSFYNATGTGANILPAAAAPNAHTSVNPFFPTPETPVLVIGGGPVGLISAILLARHGIRSTIIEKHQSGLDLPKAHVLGPRTLEILRQSGLDIDRLRKLGVAAKDADTVRFVSCLVGYEYGSIHLEPDSTEGPDVTPEKLVNVPQPRLEEYLYEVAVQTGLVTLWRGMEWKFSAYTADGFVESLLFNKRTQNTMRIRSKYLLACDGANASSRTKLDILFPDLPGRPVIKTHYVTIYFQADLSHLKSGLLFFVISPSRLGIFICYDRASTWAFAMTYNPAETAPEFFTPDYCRSVIATAIGKPIPFKILSTTIWSTHPRVVETYRSPTHPHAFLLGDAAHTFPPTGGLGLNTGIDDAHNLVWKIHAAEKGWTYDASSLLDSYHTERHPVALANAQQSYVNQLALTELVETVLRTVSDDPPITTDSQNLARLEEAVRKNKDHFQAISLHIGHVYGRELERAPLVGEYVPKCVPGARLPHAWVQVGSKSRSTLDLVDGHSFVVLATRGFPSVDSRSLPPTLMERGVSIKTMRLGVDFVDLDGDWSEYMGMTEEAAAILVRPDQHIVCQSRDVEGLVQGLCACLHL